MATPDLLIAVLWGLVWQLPWIAGLIIALLLYRRWKTSGVRLVALALGLLIVWAVAAPLIMMAARAPLNGPVVDLLAASAVSFLGSILSTGLVIFLAAACFRLMKELAGEAERRPGE